MTWDLRLGGKAQQGRKPNVQFECERCAVVVVKYLRPSRPRPRFCTKRCATATAMENATRSEAQRLAVSGPNNYRWSGASVSAQGGRKRARRMYRADECTRCGVTPAERHHMDGNTANNEPANVEIVCRRCHMQGDGRLDAVREQMRSIQPLGVKARWSR
jgi:hypothetical protein